MVATLGSGQHYLVDLVVSLPFALAVQSAASDPVSKKPERITALVSGAVLTAAWLLLVHYGVHLVLRSPIIPWGLMLTTSTLTFWLASRLLTGTSLSPFQKKILAAASHAVPSLQ